MFKRNRCGIFSAIGLIFAPLSWQAQEVEVSIQRSEQSEVQPDSLQSPILVDIVEEEFETEARNYREQLAEEREKLDLIAQQGMDAATKRMADYAFWQTLLVFLGTAALFATLWLTLRANHATRKLLALEVTPYMSVQPDGRSTYRTDIPALLFIRNEGRSSAVVREIVRCWEYKSTGENPSDIRGVANTDGIAMHWLRSVQIPVGPQGLSAPFSSLFNELDHRPSKSEWLYLHGHIDFESIDGKQRGRTGFCYVYRGDDPDLGMHVAVTDNPEKHWYYEKLEPRAS